MANDNVDPDDVIEPDSGIGIYEPTYPDPLQMDDENAMNLELDTLSAFFEANSDNNTLPGRELPFLI